MPKIVDRPAQQRAIAQSVWRVIQRDGIDKTSVRKIAAESQLSPGALRHYFSSQDELLVFSLETMLQQVAERVAQKSRSADRGVAAASAILEQLLPLDAARAVEVSVWLSLLAKTSQQATFRALHQRGWYGEKYVCRLALAALFDISPPSHVMERFTNPHLEARTDELHTHIAGLTVQLATMPHSHVAALAQLHHLLEVYQNDTP